jgi:hypothetical protein
MANRAGISEVRGVRVVGASQRLGWMVRALFLGMAAVPLVAATTIVAADPQRPQRGTDEEAYAFLPPGHPPVECEELPPGHPRLDPDEDDIRAMLPPGHPPVGPSRLPAGHPRVRPVPDDLVLFPQDGVTHL